jgi:hypothetical protein
MVESSRAGKSNKPRQGRGGSEQPPAQILEEAA